MGAQIIGRKCGMTRVFTEDGASIPVTVIKVEPNRIVQIKDEASDGYFALQVTIGKKLASRVNKPLEGHFAKAQLEAGLGLWEIRFLDADSKNMGDYKIGSELTVDLFHVGDKVDVQGVSKGKGFAGVVKRHHFATQDATHGNSLSHRVPGSIGQRQTPGRVFPGKKMAGHLGNVNRTIQNQRVVRVDKERNLLLVRGGIPGSTNGIVIIKACKRK